MTGPKWPEQECLHEDTDSMVYFQGVPSRPYIFEGGTVTWCNDCGAEVVANEPS